MNSTAVTTLSPSTRMGRAPSEPPHLSVVVPMLNERATLAELYARLTTVLASVGCTYEILFVDDGSWDGTNQVLQVLAEADPAVRVITLARNFGQTPALAAGFDHSRGEIVIAMDGDLQHAPEDLPAFLDRIREGYDVVSGWRAQRHDGYWTRRLPSRIANQLMARFSGVPLHDFGTTFKAYRRHVIKRIALHGELHRFIPALASREGARITEIPISNPPRGSNTSHYGLSRTWRVMSDLLTVRFLLRYATRPLHLFGPIGFAMLGGGTLGGLFVLARKLFGPGDVFVQHGPLLLFSGTLFTAGLNLLALGLVAELLVRVYFDGVRHRIYTVRESTTPTATHAPARTPGALVS